MNPDTPSPSFRLITDPDHVDPQAVSDLLDTAGMGKRSVASIAIAIRSSARVVAAYSTDNILIGFGRLISDGVYYGTLWDIAVHPGFRRRGIGGAIVSDLLQPCREAGFRMVGLFTAIHNSEFYRAAGFSMLDDIHAMTLDITQFEH
jgi:ribosomal protein S18 acetylase RimI-like enzyme